MTKLIMKPINKEELNFLAEAIGGFFVKVVVDIEKEILAAGAKMHVDEEQLLLEQGSKKENLWGGGYNLDTQEIAYDSIINNKPVINASSDILDPAIRGKLAIITKKLLNV